MMALDRWLALIFLLVCGIYGYTAFVTMQAGLLPFERNMAFLPNSLPKVLSVFGAVIAFLIVLNPGRQTKPEAPAADIDYRKLTEYKLLQALLLLAAMISYALLLRPVGFLVATFLFLAGSSIILGERKYHWIILASGLGSFIVWYLVAETLGIYLKPLPWFM